MTVSRTPVKLNALTFAIMLHELQQGPCTPKDLIAVTGFHRTTMQSYIRAMHSKGCIHIAGYERAPGLIGWRNRVTIYALGAGPDVAAPRPMTKAERCRQYRERQALRLVERGTAPPQSSQLPQPRTSS